MQASPSVELCKHALRNLESLHKWIGSAFPEVGIPASDKSQAVIPCLALRLTVPSRIIMGCRPEPPHTVCRITILKAVEASGISLQRSAQRLEGLASPSMMPRRSPSLDSRLQHALLSLDERLFERLQTKDIRLLRSSWLIAQPDGYRMPQRQDLELLERSGASPSPPTVGAHRTRAQPTVRPAVGGADAAATRGFGQKEPRPVARLKRVAPHAARWVGSGERRRAHVRQAGRRQPERAVRASPRLDASPSPRPALPASQM